MIAFAQLDPGKSLADIVDDKVLEDGFYLQCVPRPQLVPDTWQASVMLIEFRLYFPGLSESPTISHHSHFLVHPSNKYLLVAHHLHD